MKAFPRIESPQNPRIKSALKLRKSAVRKAQQLTLVEGFREIQRAHESGWCFKELYCCPDLFLHTKEDELIEAIHQTGTPIFQCSKQAFEKMAYRDSPDGLIALSPLVGKTLSELVLPENPLILIAEDLEKPGNLGTMLRTADAAGAHAVITCDPNTDLNNPNVIRASIGTLFYLPIAAATTEETIAWLHKNKINAYAAVPDAPRPYTSVDMKKGSAIIVGSEDCGLSNEWKTRATQNISIPMLGRNDSLNVATAAAILLFEAVRQRTN